MNPDVATAPAVVVSQPVVAENREGQFRPAFFFFYGQPQEALPWQ